MITPRRALIVVDAQREYFDGLLPIVHPPRDESIARIAAAMDAAHAADIPVAIVQHEADAGAPAFAVGSDGWQLHPEVEARASSSDKRVSKRLASIFEGTDVHEWLTENGIETITLVGYMTNNCIIGSAAAAEALPLAVEVLSDATGAPDLMGPAGTVDAKTVHETLMVLLSMNFARVLSTSEWLEESRAAQS